MLYGIGINFKTPFIDGGAGVSICCRKREP